MASKPVILVTGGNQGLGYEAIKILAVTKQYHLIVAARTQEKSEKAVREVAAETKADAADFTAMVIDVASDESISAAAELVQAKFGYLDVLVNNAGIAHSPDDKATTRQNYQAIFETNVFGVAVMNEAFRPLLRASKFPRRRIVSVSSGLGLFGVAVDEKSPWNLTKYPIAPAYRASKSALNMMAAFDNIVHKEENIPTVLVEPGYCRTNLGNYQGGREPALGGAVIARAVTDGENKDVFLKMVSDDGLQEEFGW